SWRSTLIDGGDPRAILRRLTADRVEVDAADLRGDRTGLAFADLAVVDAGDRRGLRPGAAQEDLIGDIELSAVHLTDRRVDPSVRRDLEDRRPNDPLEDVVGRWRRHEDPVADEEEVLGAALGDMTVLGQHDGLVEPGLLRLGLRERRIDVRARDLASRRDRVVISAAQLETPQEIPRSMSMYVPKGTAKTVKASSRSCSLTPMSGLDLYAMGRTY